MSVTSIRRELRLLRYYAVGTTVIGGLLLLGAASAVHDAHNATFNTITVHKIIVKDHSGKMAMVLTNHDDPMPSIFAGKKLKRQGGGGNEIIFYNPLGNEQGGLMWDGELKPDGTYRSGNTLSYDSVTTDQLLQVDDGNDNGKLYSYMIGWNRPNVLTGKYAGIFNQLMSAKTDAERKAIITANPDFTSQFATRYLFGYDKSNTAQVMLADAKGHPRIKMFVTPAGEAKLEFLDANGKVTAEYPNK